MSEAGVNLRTCFPAVAFGTSGLRALVTDLTDEAVAAYVTAFVHQMKQAHACRAGQPFVLGMDLRPSSPDLAAVVHGTLERLGHPTLFVGVLPTPALALYGLTLKAPAIMVTGSHIPFDRNGIKFYSPAGEILKADEAAMMNTPLDDLPLRHSTGALPLPAVDPAAAEGYRQRYFRFFGENALRGLRLGVYEHSAAGRDITVSVLRQLGAEVLSLGRCDTFIPIDTEAVSDADLAQAAQWCATHRLDALVSTDGDGDRPLVFDQRGQFVRGDLLGLLCARALGVQALAMPVSCNSAVEKAGGFVRVVRTRIGSPYVVAAMSGLAAEDALTVAGFEANGGFLLGSDLPELSALPTRDALLPMLALLARALREGQTISALVEALPPRFTHSDRLKDVPPAASQALILRLAADPAYCDTLFPRKGRPLALDTTDGARLTFADGDIIHLRPSGNAPELRCYTESGSYPQAKAACDSTLECIMRHTAGAR